MLVYSDKGDESTTSAEIVIEVTPASMTRFRLKIQAGNG